jgi:opacity protein-like surface antigen
MTMLMKFLTAGAGLAALAAAAPLSAQYYPPYAGAYGAPYGNAYGYQANNTAQFAINRCTAAVQNRLSTRTGIGGILGSMVGVNATGRVLSVTRVDPRSNTIRVRGLASSGRMAYNPYGYGYYGAVGSQYAAGADLSFKCDVDYRGRIRDIDINRR